LHTALARRSASSAAVVVGAPPAPGLLPLLLLDAMAQVNYQQRQLWTLQNEE